MVKGMDTAQAPERPLRAAHTAALCFGTSATDEVQDRIKRMVRRFPDRHTLECHFHWQRCQLNNRALWNIGVRRALVGVLVGSCTIGCCVGIERAQQIITPVIICPFRDLTVLSGAAPL
jgi:hypothetical protein